MLDPKVMDSAEAEDSDLLPDRDWRQPLHERLAQDLGRLLAALRLV